MTEDNTTEAVETEGESNSGEDSALVKDLRAQIKAKDKELKSAPSRSEIEAEIRASVAREKAIEGELVALKLPTGLSETVEGKLGDAEVSREAVTEALKAIGFEITDSPDDGAEDTQASEALAGVTQLSNQVANAATTKPGDTLSEKIANADTPEELAQVMREAEAG